MAALLVSLVAHGVVLHVFRSRQPPGSPQHTGARSTHVRILQRTPPAFMPLAQADIASVQASPAPPVLFQDTSRPTPGSEQTVADAGIAIGNAETGAYYFPPDQLTAKPTFLSDEGAPAATFIPDVMPLPVHVQVFINERGDVDQVMLSDNFLSEVARNLIDVSFRAMHFSPGMLGALPVKSQLSFEVNLDPTLPSQ
jgi:hypothetical protein